MGWVKNIIENECNFQKCIMYIELIGVTFVKKWWTQVSKWHLSDGCKLYVALHGHTVYIAFSITKDKGTVPVVIDILYFGILFGIEH